MNSIQLRAFIAIAALCWVALLAFSFTGQAITRDQAIWALTPFSIVCTIMAFLSWAFDRWLWKLPGVNQLLAAGRRNIGGTWKLELHSEWVNPETQQKLPPIEAYMRVRQTFSRLDMKQMTKESESFSIASNMACSDDGLCEISVVYSNDPRSSVRHRSQRHFGAFRLKVSGKPAKSIEGEYWTDRNTKGEMKSVERKRELFDSFDAARNAFENGSVSQQPMAENVSSTG